MPKRVSRSMVRVGSGRETIAAHPLQRLARLDDPLRPQLIVHTPQQRFGTFGHSRLAPIRLHMIDRGIVGETAQIGSFVPDRCIIPDPLDLQPQLLHHILGALAAREPAHLPEQRFAFSNKQTRQGDRVRRHGRMREPIGQLRMSSNSNVLRIGCISED